MCFPNLRDLLVYSAISVLMLYPCSEFQSYSPVFYVVLLKNKTHYIIKTSCEKKNSLIFVRVLLIIMHLKLTGSNNIQLHNLTIDLL